MARELREVWRVTNEVHDGVFLTREEADSIEPMCGIPCTVTRLPLLTDADAAVLAAAEDVDDLVNDHGWSRGNGADGVVTINTGAPRTLSARLTELMEAVRARRAANAGGVTCAQAFHIAEYIEEEMAERGWDRDELALQMGGEFQVTRLALDLLMEVRTPDVILGEQAEQLARAFGTSAALWRNLHETWRKHPSTPRTPDADAGGDDA